MSNNVIKRSKKTVPQTKTPSYPSMIGKPSIDRREFIVLFGVGTASISVLSACGSSAPQKEPTIDFPPTTEPKIEINADSDIDSDRILDADDKCPNDPETYNGLDDEDGCPDKPRGVVVKTPGVVIRPQNILFKNKKVKVLPASLEVLDAVAQTLAANPQIESLLIVGHADSREGSRSNRKLLSTRRARNVMDHLIKKSIDKKRLRSIGLSDACPLSIGNTPDSRGRNRRVEFKVLSSDGEPTNVELGCDEAIRRKLIPEGVFKP